MKKFAWILTVLPFLGAHAGATIGYQNATAQPPAAAWSPRPVNDILAIQPFTLKTGYKNQWSSERATVSSGALVVLAVDPALAARRAAAEPILYAGSTPVQQLNDGGKSGRVIGIVPGNADLTAAPVWFGAPGLPERVTVESSRAARAQADKSGIRAFPDEKLRSVTRAPVVAADLATLLRDYAAALVLEYSPQEKELADAWRLPVAKSVPKPPR